MVGRVRKPILRLTTTIPFERFGPVQRREIHNFNRTKTVVSRLQPSQPFLYLGKPTQSPISSRKRRRVRASEFEKKYERLDRLSPLGYDEHGVLKFLSDFINPEWTVEIDFDARQEHEEELRLHRARFHSEAQPVLSYPVEMDVDDVDDNVAPSEPVDIGSPMEGVEFTGEHVLVAEELTSLWTPVFPVPTEPTWSAPSGTTPWYTICCSPPPQQVPFPTGADTHQRRNNDEEATGEAEGGGEEKEDRLWEEKVADGEQTEDEEEDENDGLPASFHSFLEQARAFENILPPPTTESFKEMEKMARNKLSMNFLNSLDEYPAAPWRYELKPIPDFPSDSGVPILGAARNKELRQRYSKLWRNEPRVWEAVIGTMLQAGVTIENMLPGDDNADLRKEVLRGEWVIDNRRFDDLGWYQRMRGQVPADCSPDFHKAPAGKERLFHEEIHYVKTHPEIRSALRTMICEWLKTPENQKSFRTIFRKAGYCEKDDHEIERWFIHYYFGEKEEDDTRPRSLQIKRLLEHYYTTRYPRFYHRTLIGYGIEIPEVIIEEEYDPDLDE